MDDASKRPSFSGPRDLASLAPLPGPWGGYQAFPTLAARDGRIFLAFRRGRGKSRGEEAVAGHGSGGDVYLTDSGDQGQTFAPPRPVLCHIPEVTNEHDALLSALPDGSLALMTRSHGPERFVNRVQFAPPGATAFAPPVDVTVPGGYGAFFGHLLPDIDGKRLLGTFYNGAGVALVELAPERLAQAGPGPVELPVRGLVHAHTEGPRLNETALARLPAGRLLALSRQSPVVAGLHVSFSDDDGRTFSRPAPIGVFGEAPALLVLPGGEVLALCRDLDPGDRRRGPPEGTETEARTFPCAVSLLHSPNGGHSWSRPRVLAAYDGGRFHGGYGDLIRLPDGRILAACHLARRPGDLPAVACYRFRLR